MARAEKARMIARTGGLIVTVTSLVLFLYSTAIGWGAQHPLTVGGFIMFAGDGVLVTSMSVRRVIFDLEYATEKAARLGYKTSELVKMKYKETVSRAILLWFVLIPMYTASLMLYIYFIVEPTGISSTVFAYVFAVWSLPVTTIFLFVFLACFYMRGRELRMFVWRVYGLGGRKKH